MVGIGIGPGLDGWRASAAPPPPPPPPSNLIDNGTFDDTSAWTLGPDAAIVGGKLVMTAADLGEGTASQDTNSPIVENLFYLVEFTLSDSSSVSITPWLGGAAGTGRGLDGVYSEYLRAGATQEFLMFGVGTGAVDDVSLTGPIATPLNTELCPDPGFDDAGAWTIGGSGASVTGGALVATGGIGNRSATCIPDGYPLNAGTYDTTFTIVSRTAGSARVEICGILGTNRSAVGTYNQQIVVTEADTATQSIVLRMITSPNMTVDNLSVKKIA